jgi:flavodoxin
MKANASELTTDGQVKKVLVAYYSRSGYTSAVAKRVARECNAELLSIKDARGRRGLRGYLRSSLEAALHMKASIRSTVLRGNYDLVVIGTPVWFWNISSPVRAFIALHRPEFKRLAFFCTYGGSGAAKVLGDMEALCGIHPVATLALRDEEIARGLDGDKLADFTKRLNGSVEHSTNSASSTAVGVNVLAHS